jgi:hypothetical protein
MKGRLGDYAQLPFSLWGENMGQVYLYNIQGFRGEYTYDLEDYLVVINSVNNGVGKTTLFDCLRFTCNYTLFDKEERGFFLNLKETEGVFGFTNAGVMHGFRVTKHNPTIFFKKVDGEELQTSYENFPNAAQDMGILIINNMILNICGKDLSLFSSSGGAQNYQLAKAITTHQPTEEALELLQRSININEQSLSKLRGDKKAVELQKSSLSFYLNIEELEELLNDDSYEDMEAVFSEISLSLNRLHPAVTLNFNSSIENILELSEDLERLNHTDYIKLDVAPVEKMDTITQKLEMLHDFNQINVNSKTLENILKVNETLESLCVTEIDNSMHSQTVQNMLDLYIKMHTLQPSLCETFNTEMLNRLLSVYIRLTEMRSNLQEEKVKTQQASSLKQEITEHRVECPIRREVYLVNGICHYE